MTAFDRIEPAHGVSPMNSINSTILHSLFMPFFYGTTIVGLAFIGNRAFSKGRARSHAHVGGRTDLHCGYDPVHDIFNVPLNNAPTGVDPAKGTGVSVWSHYLKVWTLWNQVRSISSTATCALYIGSDRGEVK